MQSRDDRGGEAGQDAQEPRREDAAAGEADGGGGGQEAHGFRGESFTHFFIDYDYKAYLLSLTQIKKRTGSAWISRRVFH